MDQYVSRKEVLKLLKIHYQTLYRMEERGEIEVIRIGTKRLYNLDKYIRAKGLSKNNKKNICYCRVSSQKQKKDLVRQVEYMKEKYPNYDIISDIGSGLNMNREGLKKIIKMGINGDINELVIAYKDRLARFGFELIEWIIKTYSKGTIKIINNREEPTPEEEIVKDIIQIMNIYTAKVNGLRKYKKQIKDEIKKDILEEDISKLQKREEMKENKSENI